MRLEKINNVNMLLENESRECIKCWGNAVLTTNKMRVLPEATLVIMAMTDLRISDNDEGRRMHRPKCSDKD